MAEITIFTARKVITMNAANPFAEAVAVRDGRILGAGTVDELAGWGDHDLDTAFADHVILPGFIEAHSHVLAGGLWQFPYVGYYDRYDPQGQHWPGCGSLDDVVERLRDLSNAITDPAEPLLAWGLDPIYFPGERLVAQHLDRASSTRPIFVFHVSGHLATVNSAVLRQAGITAEAAIEGIERDASGRPNGELREPRAMAAAGDYLSRMFGSGSTEQAIENYGALARNSGCTLVTELGTTMLSNPAVAERWQGIVNREDFPARVALYYNPAIAHPGEGLAAVPKVVAGLQSLRAQATPKLRFPGVKMILDGSIQGFSARLCPPGYYQSGDNGIFVIDPERFPQMVRELHRANVNIHVHCNGDEATELFVDSVEAALQERPWLDHRHTVEHCQLTRPEQYRRMARLGVAANIFSNHLWYWGDQHYEITVGPERAKGMDACGTALREGVRFSIHSDAHVTPLGQLHTAWCAVNRMTPKGRVLGEHERIGVADALRAITLDAAYLLHLDSELGSIQAGKLADFTILEQDPLDVDPVFLRDIPVWGTVVGGVKHQAR